MTHVYWVMISLLVVVASSGIGCTTPDMNKLATTNGADFDWLNETTNLAAELDQTEKTTTISAILQNQIQQVAAQPIYYPIAEYQTKRTKKVFGQYITANSGDRFQGYHTGDDIEVADTTVVLPVYAVTAATIVRKQVVSGYGGVLIVEFKWNDTLYHALYGHLDIASVQWQPGDTVTAGQRLGELGDHESSETDGERKHLHFGLYQFTGAELFAGYVPTEAELTAWQNPADFFESYQALTPSS
ncbi:MAG: M23 family metallopeptidase [Candidatus Kerfeldbacteria bacterium]|nr:M23 family metallopeptidase [Candidatus Kerfeldbacteria bacterium]